MKDNKRVLPLPEVAVAFRGDVAGGKWEVKAGSSQRGGAYTDFASRKLVAPVVDDETARLIRNHELTHARISPANDGEFLALVNDGISERVTHCSEELRVNTVLKGLGFDTDLLSDGTERKSGERLSQDGSIEAWNEAVAFSAALIGSKAYSQFIGGIRKHNPEWATQLKAIGKEVQKIVKNVAPKRLGDTTPVQVGIDEEGNPTTLPSGFHNYTRAIGSHLQRSLRVRDEETKKVIKGAGGKATAKTEGEKYGTGYGGDVFAPLILDDLPLTVPVAGYVKQRKTAQQFGKTFRYPERHLTDPQRRVFGAKRKVKGGIVVIDQSGSMDIANEDLGRVLKQVPGALVIGYSHKANSTDGTPNAWVLAKNGKRVKKIRDGNVGNGVDGPVLDFAISQRKGNEPIIWVCDGQVTGANDRDPGLALTTAVANIVLRHGIIQVTNISESAEALAHPDKFRGKYAGRTGTVINDIRRNRVRTTVK